MNAHLSRLAFALIIASLPACAGSGTALPHSQTPQNGGGAPLQVDGYSAAFSEYALPNGATKPQDMTVGPDGAVWFPVSNGIDQVTEPGKITEFSDPAYNAYGPGITSANGMLWSSALLQSDQESNIVMLAPNGTFSSMTFAIPGTNTDGALPLGFASQNGNVYFTFNGNFESGIGAIPQGAKTYSLLGMPAQSDGYPYSLGKLTVGSDHAVYATGPASALQDADDLYRCPPDGSPCTIAALAPPLSNLEVYGIAAGADGNFWIAEQSANAIAKVSPAGAVLATYPIPTASSSPTEIIGAPDGTLWFTEFKGNKLGRITTSGTITEYPIPTPNSGPWGITTCPTQCEDAHGRLWFTEQNANKVGKLEY